MNEFFSNIGVLGIIYAAFLAFIITNIILRFNSIRKILKNDDELKMEYKGVDINAVLSRCKTMFPIDTIVFGGSVFKSGMTVKIVTMQKKVIEGQLIGKNNMDILCVLTSRHVIAHEIDKIEFMEKSDDDSFKTINIDKQ